MTSTSLGNAHFNLRSLGKHHSGSKIELNYRPTEIEASETYGIFGKKIKKVVAKFTAKIRILKTTKLHLFAYNIYCRYTFGKYR